MMNLEELKSEASNMGYRVVKIAPKREKAPQAVAFGVYKEKGKFVSRPDVDKSAKNFITCKKSHLKTFVALGLVEDQTAPEPVDSD
jgi:hypothetical protein